MHLAMSMLQGWHNDDYLILFADLAEAETMTGRYQLPASLLSYTILGLKNWDDFIVRDAKGDHFTLPSVPLDVAYIRPLNFKFDLSKILPDPRLADKIKWHIQPLIFSGSPSAQENRAWITLDQHVEAVKWWNDKYFELKQAKET